MTKTAKHTPGPWLYAPAWDSDGVVVGIDHFVIADEVEVACPPREADARLIAAAPDLLAACQMVLKVLAYGRVKDPSDPDYVNAAVVVADRAIAEKMVREAVAKATGE